ncbi:MAG: phage head-tail connector protein [Eubacteriales bacterium]|nr:phage head-tail connector protein [Eubacteriales bacterium]
MTEIEKIKKLTGESNEELLSLLYDDAKEFVLSYTNRTKLIPPLEKPTRDITIVAYNRRGTEGEAGRSEGGESYSFDNAPKQIYDILHRYRLARVGGKTYEAKTKQD